MVTKNYQAQAELGDLTNKVLLMEEEKARFLRLIDNESRALQDCTNHIKTMEQSEVAAKKAFIDEMQGINDEMASLLQRRMMLKAAGYVSPESVSAVVAKIEKQNKCTLVNYKKHHDELVEATKERDENRSRLLQLGQELQQRRGNDGVLQYAAMEEDECIDGDYPNGLRPIPSAQEDSGSEHMDLFYD